MDNGKTVSFTNNINVSNFIHNYGTVRFTNLNNMLIDEYNITDYALNKSLVIVNSNVYLTKLTDNSTNNFIATYNISNTKFYFIKPTSSFIKIPNNRTINIDEIIIDNNVPSFKLDGTVSSSTSIFNINKLPSNSKNNIFTGNLRVNEFIGSNPVATILIDTF